MVFAIVRLLGATLVDNLQSRRAQNELYEIAKRPSELRRAHRFLVPTQFEFLSELEVYFGGLRLSIWL